MLCSLTPPYFSEIGVKLSTDLSYVVELCIGTVRPNAGILMATLVLDK